MKIPEGWPTGLMVEAALDNLPNVNREDVVFALKAALAAAPTPPAQEDKPHCYEVMGYKPRSKSAFVCAVFPDIETANKYASELKHPNIRALYTRPADDKLTTRVPYREAFQRGAASCDKLRKTAEDLIETFDRSKALEGMYGPCLVIENLRAALEGK